MENKAIFTTEGTCYRAVAVYQYSENYGYDWTGNGKNNGSRWKCKGGHDEILADGLTSEMINDKDFVERLWRMGQKRGWHNEMSSAQFMYIQFEYSTLWLDERLINADDHYDYSTLCLWEPDFARANYEAETGRKVNDKPESWERYEALAELAQ